MRGVPGAKSGQNGMVVETSWGNGEQGHDVTTREMLPGGDGSCVCDRGNVPVDMVDGSGWLEEQANVCLKQT